MRLPYHDTMKSADLIKCLETEGWIRISGTASHQTFAHPTRPGPLVVPRVDKDIPREALRILYERAAVAESI